MDYEGDEAKTFEHSFDGQNGEPALKRAKAKLTRMLGLSLAAAVSVVAIIAVGCILCVR